MSRSLLSMVAVLATFTLVPLSSALALDGVAVINIQDIMRDSLAAKSVKSKLEAKQKSFQSEMTSKENALQEQEKTLIAKSKTLTPEQLEKESKDFRTGVAKTQRDVATKKAKLDKAFADALSQIQKTVVNITKQIATERKIQVVMPTSQMLYADPSLDITKEVLTKLNQQLPSVAVNF